MIAIVGQDDFYRQDESFARVAGFDNWDAVDAIEWDRVAAALLQRCGAPADVVVNVQARS